MSKKRAMTKKAKLKREKTKKAKEKREKTKKAKMKSETTRRSENPLSPLRFIGNKRKSSTVLEEEPKKNKRRETSKNTLPRNTLPRNTLPRNTLPRNTVSSTLPRNTVSSTLPRNTLPRNTLPRNTLPRNTESDTSRTTNKSTYGRDISTSGKEVPWQAETKSSTHHSLTLKMEYPKKTLDSIKLPSYVMRSTDYYKSVEDYIIDHYPFLRASPGKNPIVDAYDKVNKCYVDIKVTTKYSAGKTVLTSSGQLDYLKDDDHNRGYYLIVRNTGGRPDIVDIELLFAAPAHEKYVKDKTHQYVANLKKHLPHPKSQSVIII